LKPHIIEDESIMWVGRLVEYNELFSFLGVYKCHIDVMGVDVMWARNLQILCWLLEFLELLLVWSMDGM